MQIPILWRYLLRHYFQILGLCVFSFIGTLLVLRFQEIARFAASGAGMIKILGFSLLQIPYILPISIPVSCLIASMLLFQRLSHAHELTAFRTSGIGLKEIIKPLLFAGLFLTLINFTITSEIAPRCRGVSKALIFDIASSNPLFLLQKESLVKLKNAYFEMKTLQAGKSAKDVVLVLKNSSNDHLAIVAAKKLSLKEDLLQGLQVAIISSVDAKTEGHDHLVIENQAEMNTQAANLSQFVQTADWMTSYDYMPLRTILAKDTLKNGYLSLSKNGQIEISRRLSLSLAPFTFTLIGIAFGTQINRNRSKKGILTSISLAAFFLVCFISAKTFKASPLLATSIFLVPHPLIHLISFKSIRSIQRGIE